MEIDSFDKVLEIVERELQKEWNSTSEIEKPMLLERQKKAILGYEEDIRYYKLKIGEIIAREELSGVGYPKWYKSLIDAVFNELYGLSGIAPWVYDETEEYRKSSSLKMIGENVFCLIDGKSCLQPQKISKRRREQLKRTFLMSEPRERIEKGFHELYLKNGIRVTIFSGDRTRDNLDVMVFRKYLVTDYSFENFAEMETIPKCAIPVFKQMIKLGFNVLFIGPVRSGKTTFLQTWQKYEDRTLEGLSIATDPETKWENIMPDAPLMQLICDGKDLENITKSILRGDNDYILLEEMRDEIAFKLALDVTSLGTRRSKATVHSSDPVMLPYRMASAVRSRYGGSLDGLIQQFYTNFNFALEFAQVESDRSRKKLMGIYEYCYDSETDTVAVYKICEYNREDDDWNWHFHLSEDKWGNLIQEKAGLEELEKLIKENEKRRPIEGMNGIYPSYYGEGRSR